MQIGERVEVPPVGMAFRQESLDFCCRPGVFAEGNERNGAIKAHVDVRLAFADFDNLPPLFGHVLMATQPAPGR